MAYTDDFNRADGALGANWTANGGACDIASNVARCLGTGRTNNRSAAHYSAGTFDANQYAQVVVSTATRRGGVIVRADTGGAQTYYEFNGNGSDLKLYLTIAGTGTPLTASLGTVSNGDILKLTVEGSGASVTLKCYKNGELLATVEDTSDSGLSGKPGICGLIYGDLENAILDDWEGGDLATQSQAPRTMHQFSLRR